MLTLNRLYNWYGKRVVRGVFLVVLMLIVAGIFFSSRKSGTTSEPAALDTESVRLASVTSLATGSQIEFIGSVEALSEAHIQSETSGRVTNVAVSLGGTVSAGQVIAELENARQRAAVLQAEGAYEAALASAGQSDISLSDAESALKSAKTAGINTYRNAFATVDNLILNQVDDLFSNSNYGTPSFGLNGLGMERELDDKRVELRSILNNWSDKAFTSEPNNIDTLLTEAKQNSLFVASMIDDLSRIVSDEKNSDSVINGNSMDVYKTAFFSARTNLNQTIQSIENAQSAITNAQATVEKLQLSGTAGEVTTSNAQVKQALGALRGAQANLELTIFRSPISGTVNQLNVKTGDFVGSFQPIAVIANNNAFIITAYVGKSDSEYFSVGSKVKIDKLYDGIVTHVAPAYDVETGKIEIKISTDTKNLHSGDTVSLTAESTPASTSASSSPSIVRIPLTSVRLTSDNAFVFTVENNSLVAHKVTLGDVNGSEVEVMDGINPNWNIVVDARGLVDKQKVQVIN
jgi:multidrug resistance efflux pump